MRLSTTLTSGLSAAAALVLLTACGGSDSDDTAASASSSGSSAAGTSSAPSSSEEAAADPDAEAFCTEAQAVFTDLGSAAQDPANIGNVFAEASERISAIEAPAEISDSWTTLTDAFAGIVTDIQGLDLTTPEGQAAADAALGSLDGEAATAQSEVQAYFAANCQITVPTS